MSPSAPGHGVMPLHQAEARSRGLVLRHYPLDIGFDGPKPHRRPPPGRGKYAGEGQLLALLSTLTSGTVSPDGPCDADLYLLPFSCTALLKSRVKITSKMNADRGIGQAITENFTRGYLRVVRQHYPCFNKRRGADHFFVCCHDMGWTAIRSAAAENLDVLSNVVWVGYSAELANSEPRPSFKQRFVYGRDLSLPLFARAPPAPPPASSVPRSFDPLVPRRGPLAFFAGKLSADGEVRQRILDLGWATRHSDSSWKARNWSALIAAAEHAADDASEANAASASAVHAMLVLNGTTDKQSYEELLATAKFCLAPRGMRVWSPRLGEAFQKGCVPVVIANGYTLPLNEVFSWRDFAIIHDDTLPGLASLPARLLAVWRDQSRYDALRRRLLGIGAGAAATPRTAARLAPRRRVT